MGLMRMAARTAVVAGTATAVSGNVQRRQQAKYAQQDQQAYAQQQQAYQQPAAPAAPAADDSMAQIEKLGQMKAQGLLTDEEFTAAKAKVLGI